MVEIIDDTKSFTIALKSAYTPPVVTVSLTWIRDNYDTDKSRYITSAEVSRAASDWGAGRISEAQMNAVEQAYTDHTLLPAYPVSATAAKGQLINVNYPASGTHGATVSISCRVQNTGGSTGTFTLAMYGGVKSVRLSNFTVGAGATSSTKTITTQLPSSGSNVSYALRCIRIM